MEAMMAKPPQQELARSMANQVASAMGSVPSRNLGGTKIDYNQLGRDASMRNILMDAYNAAAANAQRAANDPKNMRPMSWLDWLRSQKISDLGRYNGGRGATEEQISELRAMYQQYLQNFEMQKQAALDRELQEKQLDLQAKQQAAAEAAQARAEADAARREKEAKEAAEKAAREERTRENERRNAAVRTNAGHSPGYYGNYGGG